MSEVATKNIPFRSFLVEYLADPVEAAGFLAEARKDSPAVYNRAVREVTRARRLNPAQLAVPLDPDVTAWLQSLGKRAPGRVNAILRAAMKAADKEGK